MSERPAIPPAPGWPDQAAAGVSLHFSSLPAAHGIGDIGDAACRFADQLAQTGLSIWQVLPAGPTGFGDSPYQSLSAFAGNEMLIGLEPLVRDGLLNQAELAPLEELPDHAVDFERLVPRKRAILKRAAERFLARGADSRFDAFVARNNSLWLHQYALYRVIKTLHSERAWTEWEPDYARRSSDALARVESQHESAIERIKALQYLFECQWSSLREHAGRAGVRVFGDMPFYIAFDSADAWAQRALLLTDDDGRPSAVAGVPPDYFSADGQLWGNPLYDWPYHADSGYRWWIERLREAIRRCHMVRVDHFRGFESYWSVTAGADTARDGKWKTGPGDAFFDALAAALGALPIVAEDLGEITDAVTDLRRRHGIPGMKVLQFELADENFDPAAIPDDCACYTATHDNDTTAGWFAKKARRDTRRNALRLTGGKASTISHDLIRLALKTPARVAMAPMQDYLELGAEARMNTPGTAAGNWRWRMLAGQWTAARRAAIADLVRSGGRVGSG